MFKLLESYIRNITDIDAQSMELIFSKFKLIKVNRNQLLLDYEEVCRNHYFVNKGALRVYTLNNMGVQTIRYFALAGEFGTALPSFIDQKPAFEYLQAIQKSELLTISRTDFYQLVDELPEFAIVYRRILERGFIIAQKRIYGFQGLTAIEKVAWIKHNQPNILLKISNKMAASYIGISPSTLSRMKAKL